MRAEDRKPSKRVFPLLQNLDLDSVTFAQIQSTGNPISVEDMNVQEMFDLVLCNLARLVCVSEWTGLLEAGGGGNEFNGELTKYNWDGDGDPVRIFANGPYGTIRRILQTAGQTEEITLYPFIAPNTGTISAVDITVTTASTGTGAVDVGFYSDNDGVPETFLGEFVLATTSVASVSQTTSSADVDTVRGTQYWVSFFMDEVGSTPAFYVCDWQTSGAPTMPTGTTGSAGISTSMFQAGSSGNATITDWTAFSPNTHSPINLGVKW